MIRTVYMLLAFCAGLPAQSAPQPQVFEVASVKPADPNARGSSISFPNGRFTATNISVKNCITMAYNIRQFQVAGDPRWISDERYDIAAKMESNGEKPAVGPERMAQMRAALQALLAERFQLAVHRETMNSGKMTAQKISIKSLAENLAGNLDRPVLDMTGIIGVFDLTLEWSRDDGPAAGKPAGDGVAEAVSPSGPSIFTALQEQLGLKLDTQKAPVEMIVIDRVEKATAN